MTAPEEGEKRRKRLIFNMKTLSIAIPALKKTENVPRHNDQIL